MDNGIGIKEEDKIKLFQLFGFLDASKELNMQGIGLGLYITGKSWDILKVKLFVILSRARAPISLL